jgi:TonB family protein
LRALVISLALHAGLLGGLALIPAGLVRPMPREDPGDSRFELHPVARAAAEPEMVVAPPTRVSDDRIPGGEPAMAALFPEEADEEPPPLAAPSIAVDGGAHAPVTLATDWVPRVSAARSLYFGRGHGSRRGGTGAGGSGGGTGTGPAPEPEIVATAIVVELPPVRIDARLEDYAAPSYPRSARERGLEGLVRIEVDVQADGSVGEVRIVASSGVVAFDEAAVTAVRGWRFSPATVDGVAVSSRLTLPPIRFRLE